MKEQKENRMAVEPVGKLMLSMGIPMVLSMMLQAVYNIVDSAFVGGMKEGGEQALNALTRAFPVQMLMVAIGIGTGVGMGALLSKSLGQGDRERIRAGIRYGLGYTLAVMAAGTLLLEVFAAAFAGLFGLSGTTRTMFIIAMRIISVSFVFAGANVAYQGIFQALESGLESLIVSVCRQVALVLPVAWGLSLPARENPDRLWLVWLTFLIAEGISCLISVLFMRRIRRRKLEDGQNGADCP